MPADYQPNDPQLTSWVDVPPGHDFPIQNLPLGVFECPKRGPRAGIGLGERIVDLAELSALGYLKDLSIADLSVFSRPSLNSFIGLGRPVWRALRSRVSWLLNADNPELRDQIEHRQQALLDQSSVRMLLPVEIGDYVDFYSSKEHASNLGSIFRDPANPLLPNWLHLPVGYHGRTSSIIPSGRNIHRPRGQVNPDKRSPEFVPSRKLDFELEMGFIVGKSSELGSRLGTAEADDYIFGMVIVNDWSARDIQQWEYVPLGPFLGKSFATSVAPWVVMMEALESFRVAGPEQDPPVLPYLQFEGKRNLDLHLEVYLQPDGEREPHRICRTNFRNIYWNMPQQLAHLTSNGTNIRVGDLCASGTVSGSEHGSFGSMMEIAWNGSKPVTFPSGAMRSFLEDADTVVMRAWGERKGVRIGFGELRTKVLPALP